MENALLHTIPQLPYHVLYHLVLRWLSTLNRRHLKAALPLASAYVAGLVWVRGAATCNAIAAGGRASHDALNRLLIGPCLLGLLQLVALSLVDRYSGYLILDVVLLDKTGKHMAGLHKLRDSKNRYVWAYAVVVLAWTDGRVVLPLSYRMWKPPRTRNEKGKPSFDTFDGQLFHTQLKLATHLLGWAKQRDFRPTAVLFDAYFLSDDILKCLKGMKWEWVSRIKGNRNLIRGGEKYKPEQWTRATGSTTADLPGWGPIRLLNSPPRKGKGETTRHLVGSNPNWGRGTIERLYSHRWAIECLFRAGKQITGLNDCQCQSWQAQHNHLALSLLAFCFLQSQCRKQETAGQCLTRLQRGELIPMPARPVAKVRPLKWDPTLKKPKYDHDSLSAEAA